MNTLSSEVKTTPCWGAQVCDARGWDFDEVFRHQFRISRIPCIASQSWGKLRLGSFWIEHCPHLPMSEVRNRRGQCIGWCLGVAVNAAGSVFGAGDGEPLTVTATFDAIERRHAQLAGRFALLVQIGDEVRYYPDATSGLTAVLNQKSGVIASTVTLAIDDEINPSGGRSLREIERKPTLYLMDETPDARVAQLRGNHFVDLKTLTSQRFWPKDDTPFETHETPSQNVIQITERLQTIMAALVTNFRCTIPITGGRDSRLLAAAVPRDAVDKVTAFHVHEINWSTGFDVEAAKLVTDHLGLPLTEKRVLAGECDVELADLDIQKTRAQMALATGYAHPRLHRTVIQAMHVAPPSQLLLRGGAAEVAQANKWPMPARIPEQITPDFAFQRLAGHSMKDMTKLFGKDTTERYWEKYKTWFMQLPRGAQKSAVDVGHMELWLSSGMGAVFYAPRRHFYVNPFSEQRLLHATLGFSPKTRKQGRLVKALLEQYSPGLAEVPYARQLMADERVA